MNTSRQHEALIRSEIWSKMLRDRVIDETMAQKYVQWLTEFTDGNKITMPTIGQLDVRDYAEDTAVQYMPLDSGEFQFEITEYKQSGTYITEKARLDGYYMSQLENSFVPRMSQAIAFDKEAFTMRQGQPVTGGKAHAQVANDENRINGYKHRWVGSGTRNSKRVLDVNDFAYANLAFDKINIPQSNRIAIVDPGQGYILETEQNLVNFSDNPRFEGIVTSGLTTNMKFVRNIFGWDIYTSNYLPFAGVDSDGSSETIGGVSTAADAKVNTFFSATQGMLPWIGAWRQQPKVEGEWNKDMQRQEYITTAYYGVAPQNVDNRISILTDQIT